jgi:hypothetical protein
MDFEDVDEKIEDPEKDFGDVMGEMIQEAMEQVDEDRVKDEGADIFTGLVEDMVEEPGEVFQMQEKTTDFVDVIMDELDTDREELQKQMEAAAEEDKEAFESVASSFQTYGFILTIAPYQEPDEEVYSQLETLIEDAKERNPEKLEKAFFDTEMELIKMVRGFEKGYYNAATAKGSKQENINKKLESAENISEGLYKPTVAFIGTILAARNDWSLDQNYGSSKQNLRESELDFSSILVDKAGALRNAPAHLSFTIEDEGIRFIEKDGSQFMLTEDELDEKIQGMINASKDALYSLKKLYFLNVAELTEEHETREEMWEEIKEENSLS